MRDLTPEALVAEILSFAARDEERLHRLLDWTGLQPATIREAAAQPGFLAAVIDYAQCDDVFRKVFTFATGWTADQMASVRAQLELPVSFTGRVDRGRISSLVRIDP